MDRLDISTRSIGELLLPYGHECDLQQPVSNQKWIVILILSLHSILEDAEPLVQKFQSFHCILNIGIRNFWSFHCTLKLEDQKFLILSLHSKLEDQKPLILLRCSILKALKFHDDRNFRSLHCILKLRIRNFRYFHCILNCKTIYNQKFDSFTAL